MSHRTQITLSDSQYERLKEESERTGVSLSELIRRALSRVYSAAGSDDVQEMLDQSFGAWPERDEDGATYVDEIRPGLARRLEW